MADVRERRMGIGRATVFRALDLLLELGVVERPTRPTATTPTSGEPSHHHHVVCSRCGRATDIADAGLTTVVDDIEARTGYRIDRHRLELFGVCPVCREEET